MDRFRRLTFFAWLALFAYLFIGYESAGASLLCIDKHHVKFETSSYGWGAIPTKSGEPVDKRHGDHCVDIYLAMADAQSAIHKNQQTDLPSPMPDIVGLLRSGSAFEKSTTEYFYHSKITRKSDALASLGSVILLI